MKRWLEIATNLGVIAGLVLVAYQINQANEALRQESIGQQMETYRAGGELMGDFWMRIAENQQAASIWYEGNRGDDLEEGAAVQYRLLAEEYFNRSAAMYAMFEALGKGRGGWALAHVIQDVEQHPGLRRALDSILEEQGERDSMGYHVPPQSNDSVTNEPFWLLVRKEPGGTIGAKSR